MPAGRARLGVAFGLAGGLELALAFWLARGWATTTPTGSRHHAMFPALPPGMAITSADGMIAVFAALVTALVAALGHRRVISRAAARDLVAASLTLAVTLSPATCAIAASSHLASMVQLELAAVVAPILLVHALSSRFRPRPGTEASALSAAVLLVAWLGFPTAIVALHLPSGHDTIAGAPSMHRLLLTGIALCATAMWAVTLSPVLPYTPIVRLATLIWSVETVSLIGLALILAGQPIYPHTGGPLEPLTDQRLAGALMMIVELAVAVPVAKHTTTALRAAQSGHHGPVGGLVNRGNL